MEIERVNENTVKFYLSYEDIEARGFKKEEIWFDRFRSEELFLDMMDEINEQMDFYSEGPLWIQVQSAPDGMEVTITKAQLPDGEPLETDDAPSSQEGPKSLSSEELEQFFSNPSTALEEVAKMLDDTKTGVYQFEKFDDVLPIAERLLPYEEELKPSLYAYEDNYYLYIETPAQLDLELDVTSILLEQSTKSKVTIHLLEEYGTCIMEERAFSTIQTYF